MSLTYDSALPDDRTDCLDPTTPAATGGAAGTDLLVNGDFGTGLPDPWVVFGTLSPQVSAGVFEFIRPNPTQPAGAILQPTGQPMAANEIVSATFDLGNSSASRKRVTVLLHDSDFTDLAACTFWLPPGQPLAPYSMSAFATKSWTNATISIYAATVDTDHWARLDNVTLRQTPSATIVGTECVEPPLGGVASRPVSQMQPATSAPAAATRVPATRSSAGAADSDRSSVPLNLPSPIAGRIAVWSGLPAGANGEIQISTDGVHWRTVVVILGSDDGQGIDLDLTQWLGESIQIRFVIHLEVVKGAGQ